MAIYELRTYTLHVGKIALTVKLYTEHCLPALHNGGHDNNLLR